MRPLRSQSGASLVEVLVVIGAMGGAVGGLSASVNSNRDSAKAVELRTELGLVVESLARRIDCEKTFAPLGGACANNQYIQLYDFSGQPITTGSAGSAPFTNAYGYAGDWWLKTRCDTVNKTLEVRIARRRQSAYDFQPDPLNKKKLYSFESDLDTPATATSIFNTYNPVFGTGPLARGIPKLCEYKFDASVTPPKVPVFAKDCGAGKVASAVDQTGTLACVDKGPNYTCPSTPVRQVVIGVNLDGSPKCGAPMIPNNCGGNGSVVIAVRADGTVTCGTPSKNLACPAGTVAYGNSGDGTPKCRAPVPATTCTPPMVADGNTAAGTVKCVYPVPDSACPAGTVQNGTYANGVPKCVNKGANASCSGGSGGPVQIGYYSSGALVCGMPVPDSGCPAGSSVIGMWASGAVKCGTVARYKDCGGGRLMRGINSDGTAICDENWVAGGYMVSYSTSGPFIGGAGTANPYTGNASCPGGYHPHLIFGLDRQCNPGQTGGEAWCNAFASWQPNQYWSMRTYLCVR